MRTPNLPPPVVSEQRHPSVTTPAVAVKGDPGPAGPRGPAGPPGKDADTLALLQRIAALEQRLGAQEQVIRNLKGSVRVKVEPVQPK